MARLQQKRSGRKRAPETLSMHTVEIRRASGAALERHGVATKSWGAYGGKDRRPTATQRAPDASC
jgi:hypothetical protein